MTSSKSTVSAKDPERKWDALPCDQAIPGYCLLNVCSYHDGTRTSETKYLFLLQLFTFCLLYNINPNLGYSFLLLEIISQPFIKQTEKNDRNHWKIIKIFALDCLTSSFLHFLIYVLLIAIALWNKI